MSFEAELKKQLQINIEKAAIHLQTAIKEELNVTGNPYIAARGKSVWHKNLNPSAPGEAPHKMLGDLQRSIVYKVGDLSAEVGTNLPYAAALELGSSQMAARPFLRSTLAREGANLARIIATGSL